MIAALAGAKGARLTRRSAIMIGLGHIAVSLVLFVPSTVVVADPTFAELGGGNGDAPRVGLYGLQGCTTSTTDEACMQNTDMVEALDADHYLFGEGIVCGEEGLQSRQCSNKVICMDGESTL